MATIDMTQATQGIDMNDPDLAAFTRAESRFTTLWSWITPDGHDIDLNGSGITYDASGRALTGTVTSIAFDLGNDNFSDPDVFITKIAVDASPLDNGRDSFWSFLSGNDTFLGPLIENGGTGFSRLFGDAFQAPAKAAAGGDDLFRAGDTSIHVAGDVFGVNTGATFTGGDDRVFGAPTEKSQGLSGDAFTVQGTGVLIGGDDVMAIRAVSSTASFAFGDATTVHGFGGLAKVLGGDDRIIAEDGSSAQLSGDVGTVVRNALVTGGDDTIGGSARGEAITGDVLTMLGGIDVEITGGDDTLNGNGGNDIISGDVHVSKSGGIVTGGNDTIRGGEGGDRIFGEIASGDAPSTGGNDTLFGDAGNDLLSGQTGNDTLDGGAGADALDGGAGIDTASYAAAAAAVVADLVTQAFNTGEALGDTYKGIERLAGSAHRDILKGDANANLLSGGLENDVLIGRGGADILAGQGGNDLLIGGTGNDTLVGGGGGDFFAFERGGGVDTAFDYDDALDRLDLRSFGFSDFAAVAALASDTAQGLRLAFGGGDALVAANLTRATFDASDVLI